jgi:hypothetical protein
MRRHFTSGLILVAMWATAARGDLVESGGLNYINDPGNPSHGLAFLDMSYSVGRTLASALANAQVSFANARLATPQEWDELFDAANINYNGALMASDAFETGAGGIISSGDSDVSTLISRLGPTFTFGSDRLLYVWSDPDGSQSGTRDVLDLIEFDDGRRFVELLQSDDSPPHPSVGWMIVVAVPETSSAILLAGAASLGAGGCAWRRRRRG